MSTTPERTKILVPIDFSQTARLALDWALEYAQKTPSELHVVHVIEVAARDLIPGQEKNVEQEMAKARTAVSRELEKWAPDAEARARIGTVVNHIAFGHAASEILLVAERVGATLIVIGTHGRTGIARFLVGSVAEKVVRHADCPVVCVKPTKTG